MGIFVRLREWIDRFIIALRSLRRGNAHHVLKKRLKTAEIGPEPLDLELGYRIFTDFCKIPIWADSDAMLVQWGPIPEIREDNPFPEIDRNIGFYFQVLRQFDDGRHMGYEQLRLTWHYHLDNYLNTLDVGRSEWLFAERGADVERFLREEQAKALFQYLKQQTPYETVLYQQSV